MRLKQPTIPILWKLNNLSVDECLVGGKASVLMPLTTPPCSEDLRWFVLKNPVTVSKDQTASFRKIYPLTNRPVQALNGRKILAGGD